MSGAGRLAAALAGLVIAAAGLVTGGAPALAAPPRAEAIVGDSVLTGVTCATGAECWAVGNSEVNDVISNQVLRLSGKRWRAVPVPSPGGKTAGDTSRLYAVGCASARNCWAVGSYDAGNASRTEALFWNGRKWHQMPTPDPGGTGPGDGNDLFDVVCTAAKNCWAAGDDGHPIGTNDVQLNLILHWNGKRWSHPAVPEPGGTAAGDVSALDAVRCSTAASCWAGGTYGQAASGSDNLRNEVLHWNGKKWSAQAVPSPGTSGPGSVGSGINAMSCPTARSCWAAGSATGSSGLVNETLHWTGRKWHAVTVPDPASGADADNGLSGVACSADANCWAVGSDDVTIPLNEILHWTGRRWAVADVPQPAGTATGSSNYLVGVFCVSARECWAVGYSQGFGLPEVDQILRWTGRKWTDFG